MRGEGDDIAANVGLYTVAVVFTVAAGQLIAGLTGLEELSLDYSLGTGVYLLLVLGIPSLPFAAAYLFGLRALALRLPERPARALAVVLAPLSFGLLLLPIGAQPVTWPLILVPFLFGALVRLPPPRTKTGYSRASATIAANSSAR